MDNLLQPLAHEINTPQLCRLREKGARAFAAHGLPTAKTEAWKYTRLRDLRRDDYEYPPFSDVCPAAEMPFDCYVINICNGHICGSFPEISGVTVEPVVAAAELIGRNAKAEKHPFVALNDAGLEDGVYITFNGCLDKPLLLNYHVVPNGKNYPTSQPTSYSP